MTAWATLGSTASRTTQRKWSRINNWRRPNTGQSLNFSLKSSSSPIQKVFFNPNNFRINSGSRKRRPKPRRPTSIGTCSASTSARETPTPSGQSSGKTQLLAARPQPSSGTPLSKTGLVTNALLSLFGYLASKGVDILWRDRGA